MPTKNQNEAIDAIVGAYSGVPFDILGPHVTGKNEVTIRAFCPTAQKLSVVDRKTHKRTEMTRLREEGFFETTLEGEDVHYRLKSVTVTGETVVFEDPYAFAEPFLTDYDRHLFGEGHFLYSYQKFGAHLREVDGVAGINFAVWAPNAYRVSVVGEFNGWDARVHPMQVRGENGIWELFIPGLDIGEPYKYDLRSHNADYHGVKADPYGFRSEMRPQTASIVTDLTTYEWADANWMESRSVKGVLNGPVSVYEAHLGSWKRDENGNFLTYRELAEQLVPYVSSMGYTHIELLPVQEHPLDQSWGYQVTGFYAATSRYGTPQEFMYFVDTCHQHGIGVILDWVPGHFPKDGFALSYFDGTHLYAHDEPLKREHAQWGTYIFNYGRNEVRNFLVSNALFWLDNYHIDGLRVDAVSSMLYLNFGREGGEWIPNQYGGHENIDAIEFLREVNTVVHGEMPGAVTIAEESTSWPMVSRPTYVGGLGFTLKWNMGWMHDTLKFMKVDPVYRRWEHNKITFSIMYAFSENFVLSLSHDEVVHLKASMLSKMAGDWWQKFASLRLLLGYQLTHPGKKLNFMGMEIGQWSEWSEERQLDWYLLEWPMHAHLQHWVRDAHRIYKEQPALWQHDFDERGFRWIEPNDSEKSVLSYMRFADDSGDFVVVACNFTPVPRHGYRVGVPEAGYYREILNSDSESYGGGNVGNGGGLHTETYSVHGYDNSLDLILPPLGIVMLKLERNPG